jgi:drug/metabolite transporter (DMT)-like permease
MVATKSSRPRAKGMGRSTRLLSITDNLYLLSPLVLYGALSLFYVWILTFTPLSRAYPFVALAFALTPVLAAWLFGEPV